jgi:hypothetical protein
VPAGSVGHRPHRQATYLKIGKGYFEISEAPRSGLPGVKFAGVRASHDADTRFVGVVIGLLLFNVVKEPRQARRR